MQTSAARYNDDVPSISTCVRELVGAFEKSELDCVLALACKAFDVPIALVTLADFPTSWVKSAAATDCRSIAKDRTFYNLAAASGRLQVIDDVSSDARFDGKRLGPDGPAIRFYAGMPFSLGSGTCVGALCLLDANPRRLHLEQERLLAQISNVVAGLFRQSRYARVIDRLANDLAAKEEWIRDYVESSRRYKKMYERSSALAKIGVWECELSTEELTWTDGVYDIFELPRGSAVTRNLITGLYDDDSRIEMEELRSKAIRERGSFCLDIRIETAKGNKRWVRLSADVECENGVPARIFGLKQDITQERDLLDRLRRSAECDPLTGIANRAVFQSRILQSPKSGPQGLPLAALLLVDLDGFKQINDTVGHSAGDECLKQVAERLQRAFEPGTLVARIGGDEFAILIYGSRVRKKIERDARHLISQIRRSIMWNKQSLIVGASIGIAIPEDPIVVPSRLFVEADLALYAAKNAGRNTFRIFDSELRQKPDRAVTQRKN